MTIVGKLCLRRNILFSMDNTHRANLILFNTSNEITHERNLVTVMKSQKAKILTHFVWLSVISICVMGIILQINQVSRRYFRYGTKTSVLVDIPSEIYFPQLSTCWRYNDILNLEAVQLHKGIRLKRWNEIGFTWEEFMNQTKYFSISDWFKFTPAIEELLEGCKVRLPGKYVVQEFGNKDCIEMFNVTKYFFIEYICYQFNPKLDEQVYFMEYKLAPSYTGLLYELSFSKEFENVKKSFQTIHTLGSSYIFDSTFSTPIMRGYNSSMSSKVVYRTFRRQLKEPPYVPRCDTTGESFGTEEEMYLQMINRITDKKYGYMIPFIPLYESNTSRVATNIDFSDETFRSIFNQLMSEYGAARAICKITFSVTSVTLGNGNDISTSVYWPFAETYIIIFVPDQEFIDFLVYIGSCIGIWFGISVYSSYGAFKSISSFVNREKSEAENVNCQRCTCRKCVRMYLKIDLTLSFVHQLNQIVNN